MSGPAGTSYIAIDDFLIDCAIRETHTFNSDVTDFPVESGANITDNIRPLPIEVEIEGLVSNTPIGLMVKERVHTESNGVKVKPANDAYELFMAIREERKPVTIITSLRTYDNMALKGLSIPRGDHEDALKFTASFQQITTVENKRTIRVSVPIASNGGKGGGQKTVTKTPQPSGTDFIMFDKLMQAWYDPEFFMWRTLAVFKRDTSQGFYVDTPNKLHLYRGYYLAGQTNHEGRSGREANTSITRRGDGAGSHQIETFEKQFIMVPFSQCVLHDFIIKSYAERAVNPWE